MGFVQEVIVNYDLFLNALIASLLISYASAPIGVFLNLKRMTLMGEAISHSLLPGFALAFMFYGMSYLGLILGGLFSGLLVLGLMMGLDRFVTIKEDGVLTVVYLTFSALGILIVLNSGIKIDLSHILIGNILLIDTVWLGILLVSSVLIRLIFSRIKEQLLIVLMDPEYAQFLGIPIQRTKSIFYFLVLWILVLCFYSVGTLLALGLLLLPALIAKLYVKPIVQQVKYTLVFGILMSMIGLLLSVAIDWPTGPTIIVVGGLLFILSVFVRFSGSAKALVILVGMIWFHPSTEAAMFTSLQPKSQILLSNPYLKLFVNHLAAANDKWPLETLVPDDQSIHTYQLKPSDLKKIKRAKVFLYVGNSLEENLKKQIVQVNRDVKLVNLTPMKSFKGARDNEHFWLNPVETISILEVLKTTLASERPELTHMLEQRLEVAKTQLSDYLKSTRERFQPFKGQSILISHNSLYFLNELTGIDVRFYTNSAGPSDILNLKKTLKNKTTSVVKEYGSVNFLFESLVNEQGRSYSGEVYGEIVPASFFETKTYLDLLKLNLDSIYAILSKKVSAAI